MKKTNLIIGTLCILASAIIFMSNVPPTTTKIIVQPAIPMSTICLEVTMYSENEINGKLDYWLKKGYIVKTMTNITSGSGYTGIVVLEKY